MLLAMTTLPCLTREVAGAAIEGRGDIGVTELHFSVFNGSFTGFDGGFGGLDGGVIGFDGLVGGVGGGAELLGLVAGDDSALEQFVVARGLRFGVMGLGRVAREVGLGLTEHGLVLRATVACVWLSAASRGRRSISKSSWPFLT